MKRAGLRNPGASARPSAVPLALLVLLASPRPAARAEDYLAYKYVDYAESGDRMDVRTQVLDASQGLGPDTQLGVTLTNDAIAGASPTGMRAPAGSDQVPLSHLTDHRKEWEADLARQVGSVNVDLGASESREHDYVSRGWSLNTLSDFNLKNTTLLAGIAGHDDGVKAYVSPLEPYLPKHAFNAIIGVTQLLDPRTSVKLNVTWGRETGYLDDQYKVVEKSLVLAPGDLLPLSYLENLPDTHDFGALYASVNRAFPEAKAAIEASYRYYRDTYGVEASTLELTWLQKLGRQFTLAPNVRLHDQGAAGFYYYNLDETDITPTGVPNAAGTHYSSDYRLSSLDAVTVGLKLILKMSDTVQMDLAYDRYAMRGRDGVTPQSAYPTANIMSAGARISW
jgi:hypothetical protein